MNTMIAIVIMLGICAGIIALQIFLSGKESKWPGLIMPGISFGISLMALLGVLLFSAQGVSVITQDGVTVEQATVSVNSLFSIIITAIYIFAIFNIPTAILTAVYAACRDKRKKQRSIEKMSVQDLG